MTKPDETAVPFDAGALLRRCMGNASVAAMVLEKFEKQAPEDAGRIAEGVRRGDAEGVRRIAHGLKGTAGAIAAPRLTAIAAELEALGRTGRLEGAERCVAAMTWEVQRCLAHLAYARRGLAPAPGKGG